MANIFWNDKKSPREQAEKTLMQYVAGVFDGRFHVKFDSDDGGSHIMLMVEVDDPSVPMSKFLRETLCLPKWDGWRMITLKVPHGYIDAITLAIKRDDY
tara:strand:- start:229 stop:525 length:297 start_codon:yes stop_codon:yes gene_type:complete